MPRVLRWFLVAAALVAGMALAVPFFVPVARLLPEIAAIASQSLGQPVKIADLTAQLLPTPRVVAAGVRVGRKDEVVIGELEIVPDLLSFLGGVRTLRLIRAEQVELKEAALLIPDTMPKGAVPVDLRRLVLVDVRLQHSALKLPPFKLDARLGAGLEVEKARLETSDGALKLLLEPDGAGKTSVKLEASRWRLPLAAAPLLFDSLKAEGLWAGKQVELSKIESRQYGGTLKASARVDWSRSWQVSGTATLAGVDAAGVQKAIGREPRVSGRLGGNAKFTAAAKSPQQLAAVLALDGPFDISDGVYRGVDLAKVGDLTGSKGEGGATRFDTLRGVLHLRGRQVRIDGLCAKSSVLVAGGIVEVAPDRTLSGRLGVSVAKTGGFLGVPVALSGTAQDPIVRPTRGYTIGAVLGTVLFPGVGTALGASAGGALEGRSAGCS
jgi:hypothetical protein